MEDEAWDEAMEGCAIVVTIETVLQERAGGEWDLFGKELKEEIAGGSGQKDFGGGLWFEVVQS